MNKILITGASGFIGKALTKKLLQGEKTVYAVVRNKNDLIDMKNYNNLIVIESDFTQYSALSDKIDDEIDTMFHFAFKGGFGSNSIKDYKIQLENTIASCDAVMLAIKLKVKRFIFASTINEIEIKKYINMDRIEPRHTCIYSTAKIAVEMIGRTLAYHNGIEFVSGLIAMSYGPGNYAETLPNILIENLIKNQPLKLIKGDNKYDLIYIDDIIEAFVKIGEFGKNQKSYYVGNRNLRTFKEIITEIRDIINPKVELRFGEYIDNLNLDYSLIDLNELYNDTGFECKTDLNAIIIHTYRLSSLPIQLS